MSLRQAPAGTFSTRPPARVAAVLLTATSVVLGLQLVRVLFPLVGWYLRDTVGIGAIGLLPYALAPFVLAFFAPLVARILRAGNTLVLLATALAALRVAEQLMASPAVDLWLAIAGSTLFLWLLPLLVAHAKAGFGAGVLLGLVVDAGARGFAGTIDLSWLDAWWATAAVGVLVAIHLVVLRLTVGREEAPAAPDRLAALPLVAVGPLLFLELLMLVNQGWVAEIVGWSWGPALALVVIGGTVGVAAASAVQGPGRDSARWLAVLGGALVLPVAFVHDGPPAQFASALLAAQAGAGFLLGAAASPQPGTPEDRGPYAARPRIGAASTWLALGGVVFAMFSFLYYLSLDIAVPVTRPGIVLTAAVLCAAAGLFAATSTRRSQGRTHSAPIGVALAVLVVPLVTSFTSPSPQPGDAPVDEGYPVTVMTYNLHSAHGTDGTKDLEAIARVIEDSGAEVVGFQEISRGWVDGMVDMVGWLQRRLDMPYVAFHATTTDPLWGNAIMSRHPITSTDQGVLPELDTLIRRGWLRATIEPGAGPALDVIDTHLHHTGDLEVIHDAQVGELLRAWDGADHTVLVGDMNARPGWPQIDKILTAGFLDAWAQAGEGPGLTANAADPEHRIDWIFHTPDLEAVSAQVIESQASDHFPVVADIQPAR